MLSTATQNSYLEQDNAASHALNATSIINGFHRHYKGTVCLRNFAGLTRIWSQTYADETYVKTRFQWLII